MEAALIAAGFCCPEPVLKRKYTAGNSVVAAELLISGLMLYFGLDGTKFGLIFALQAAHRTDLRSAIVTHR